MTAKVSATTTQLSENKKNPQAGFRNIYYINLSEVNSVL